MRASSSSCPLPRWTSAPTSWAKALRRRRTTQRLSHSAATRSRRPRSAAAPIRRRQAVCSASAWPCSPPASSRSAPRGPRLLLAHGAPAHRGPGRRGRRASAGAVDGPRPRRRVASREQAQDVERGERGEDARADGSARGPRSAAPAPAPRRRARSSAGPSAAAPQRGLQVDVRRRRDRVAAGPPPSRRKRVFGRRAERLADLHLEEALVDGAELGPEPHRLSGDLGERSSSRRTLSCCEAAPLLPIASRGLAAVVAGGRGSVAPTRVGAVRIACRALQGATAGAPERLCSRAAPRSELARSPPADRGALSAVLAVGLAVPAHAAGPSASPDPGGPAPGPWSAPRPPLLPRLSRRARLTRGSASECRCGAGRSASRGSASRSRPAPAGRRPRRALPRQLGRGRRGGRAGPGPDPPADRPRGGGALGLGALPQRERPDLARTCCWPSSAPCSSSRAATSATSPSTPASAASRTRSATSWRAAARAPRSSARSPSGSAPTSSCCSAASP